MLSPDTPKPNPEAHFPPPEGPSPFRGNNNAPFLGEMAHYWTPTGSRGFPDPANFCSLRIPGPAGAGNIGFPEMVSPDTQNPDPEALFRPPEGPYPLSGNNNAPFLGEMAHYWIPTGPRGFPDPANFCIRKWALTTQGKAISGLPPLSGLSGLRGGGP